ncbi:MAG: HD domain-containing protein [Peptococcaceae bacterium]
MIRKGLILKIFDAFYMQRWNDKLRPLELIEMDKQAHKMFIAYFLGKFAEDHADFNWSEVIEGALFELLQRIVITDIKPPVFYKIKDNVEKYKKLNEYVYNKLQTLITPLGPDFCARFENYFTQEEDNINKRILGAAHNYASMWEFEIIERLNPDGFEIKEIKKDFTRRIEKYNDLEGMQQLALNKNYQDFLNLCGHLRFQARWAHLHRIPKTSVIGHSLFVAILSYLFSLELKACPKRCFNNYFSGIFHDLAEVLTRDIISPVKSKVEGLEDLIKEIEGEQMQEVLFPLIPPKFLPEIKMFIEDEFANYITKENTLIKTSCAEISADYNDDRFNPRDGRLIKAVDELAAYIEAKIAIENGCTSEEFQKAKWMMKNKYEENPLVAGINFGAIYADL